MTARAVVNVIVFLLAGGLAAVSLGLQGAGYQ